MRRALLLAAACFVIYLANLRLMGGWDTIPARLLPISILREGNVNLDEFPWLRRLTAEPYFLKVTSGGHLLSRYPVTVPLLVTPPYAAALWWLERHQVADDDVRFRLAVVVMERVNAAAIAAASVAMVLLALHRLTSPSLATGIAIVYAIGTNTWSTSSQALYQHGPAELALAGLSLCCLAEDRRRSVVAAALFAAFGVLARPTMAVFALVAVLFTWREHRRYRVAFAALAVLGGLALFAYNIAFFGRALGGYADIVRFFRWPGVTRLAGLLVSPSRGLFVYTPAALLSIPQMLRWRQAARVWLRYAAAGVLGYLLLYTCFGGWWGGYAYGPRFLTDILPALAILAAPTVERLWQRTDGRVLLLLLATWGVVVQAIGVYCDDRSWDALPVPVDRSKGRLWDWSDPQIFRALQAGWQGTELAGVLWQAFNDPQPVMLRSLTQTDLAGSVMVAAAPALPWKDRGRAPLDLVVTNRSGVAWPAFSDYGLLQVQLVYIWWHEGQALAGEGGFIKLPHNLGPGASDEVHVRVDPPRLPGTYELEFVITQPLDLEKGVRGGASERTPIRIE